MSSSLCEGAEGSSGWQPAFRLHAESVSHLWEQRQGTNTASHLLTDTAHVPDRTSFFFFFFLPLLPSDPCCMCLKQDVFIKTPFTVFHYFCVKNSPERILEAFAHLSIGLQ